MGVSFSDSQRPGLLVHIHFKKLPKWPRSTRFKLKKRLPSKWSDAGPMYLGAEKKKQAIARTETSRVKIAASTHVNGRVLKISFDVILSGGYSPARFRSSQSN